MDLADELLNDLDGEDGYSEEEEEDVKPSLGKRKAIDQDADEDEDMEDVGDVEGEGAGKLVSLPEGGIKPAEEADEDEVKKLDLGGVQDVTAVARIWSGKTLKEVMSKIAHYTSHPSGEAAMGGSDSPEYRLIVQANNLAVDIDNEVMLVHKYIRDHYAPRFPSLERLLPNPYEYLRAVRLFSNTDQLSSVRGLESGLSSATAMIVTVEAATVTDDRQLTPAEWSRVEKALQVADDLEDARKKILEYVESRMTLMAPNLSAIVGLRTAAKLMGVAGGLTGLSRMPACNVHLLGAQKKNLATGFSTAHSSHSAQRAHTGFIYQSDLVRQTEEQFKMKAQRTIGAKAVLAARMDHSRTFPDGSYGLRLREQIEKRLDKLAAPPPSKVIKALPIPQENSKKRRGGRRARKAKEAHASTELRKLQNRMKFGEAEEEVGAYDETTGLGMIGSASGRVRVSSGEAKSKAKMSKANKNRLAALKASGSGASAGSSGISSSLVFTPVQGLELVDPAAQRAKQQAALEAAKPGWFGEGRFSVVPGRKGGTDSAKAGGAGEVLGK